MYKVVEQYDGAIWAQAFDDVIDVRSPSEFAIDHVPGAINLPVLDDAQRAEVGTIYVQQSKFHARRLGAALIAQNIGAHIHNVLHDRPANYRVLVYCWRGGQRSAAMATVLSQIGWRTTTLQGGYATYRRQVVEAMYGAPWPIRAVLLSGHTGAAKTEILQRLAARGVQTLDLEGLAHHRGSLFGARPGKPQPSQKLFESRLWAALSLFDPARPVVIEAESSKIGDLLIPPSLWSVMQDAPRIELEAPDHARADYLATAYGDVTANVAALNALIDRLPVHLGKAQREGWRALLAQGAWTEFALSLIREHYDPAYGRADRDGPAHRRLATIAMAGLDAAQQDDAADRIAEVVDIYGRGCPASFETPLRGSSG